MSNYRSDPTAGAAIGNINREYRVLLKQAKLLRAMRREGLLTPEQEARAKRAYIGIYRRIWITVMEKPAKKTAKLPAEKAGSHSFYSTAAGGSASSGGVISASYMQA